MADPTPDLAAVVSEELRHAIKRLRMQAERRGDGWCDKELVCAAAERVEVLETTSADLFETAHRYMDEKNAAQADLAALRAERDRRERMQNAEPEHVVLAPDGDLILAWNRPEGSVDEVSVSAERVRTVLAPELAALRERLAVAEAEPKGGMRVGMERCEYRCRRYAHNYRCQRGEHDMPEALAARTSGGPHEAE